MATREEWLERVGQDGNQLENALPELNNDWEICMAAVKNTIYAIQYVPEVVLIEHPEVWVASIQTENNVPLIWSGSPSLGESGPINQLGKSVVLRKKINLAIEHLPDGSPEKYLALLTSEERAIAEQIIARKEKNDRENLEEEHSGGTEVAAKEREAAPTLETAALGEKVQDNEEFTQADQDIPDSYNYDEELKKVLTNLDSAERRIEKITPAIFKEMKDEEKTPELCMELVKKQGWLVQFVPSQVQKDHPQICLEALQESSTSGFVIEYMPKEVLEEYPDLYLVAVEKTGTVLELVPDPVKREHPDLCMEAVKSDGSALEYVPGDMRTREICIEAIKSVPLALKYVPEGYREECKELAGTLCMEAIENYNHTLFRLSSVPNEVITEKMCRKAVEKSPLVNIGAVPEKFMSEEMCKLAIEATVQHTAKRGDVEPYKFLISIMRRIPDRYQAASMECVPESYREACMEALGMAGQKGDKVEEQGVESQDAIITDDTERENLVEVIRGLQETVQKQKAEIATLEARIARGREEERGQGIDSQGRE